MQLSGGGHDDDAPGDLNLLPAAACDEFHQICAGSGRLSLQPCIAALCSFDPRFYCVSIFTSVPRLDFEKIMSAGDAVFALGVSCDRFETVMDAAGTPSYTLFHLGCAGRLGDKTVEWHVSRRFSEFDACHSSLVLQFSTASVPAFPAKTLFKSYDPSFLADRLHHLRVYVGELCERPMLLQSASAVHELLALNEFMGPLGWTPLYVRTMSFARRFFSSSMPTSFILVSLLLPSRLVHVQVPCLATLSESFEIHTTPPKPSVEVCAVLFCSARYPKRTTHRVFSGHAGI